MSIVTSERKNSAARPIFVIEDNEGIRETFRELLEVEGYFVVVADNGKSALELLKTTPHPSAIFLDLDMPVMNGKEFLNALQNDQLAPNVPIVVFTASRRNETLPGVVEWIKKPVDLVKLLTLVEKLCG